MTAKASNKLERVVVEEVHPSKVAKVMVDDQSPALKEKAWSGSSASAESNPNSTAWLFSDETSVFVFRFTITSAGSPPVVLYQPAWFSLSSKVAFRQVVTRINGS